MTELLASMAMIGMSQHRQTRFAHNSATLHLETYLGRLGSANMTKFLASRAMIGMFYHRQTWFAHSSATLHLKTYLGGLGSANTSKFLASAVLYASACRGPQSTCSCTSATGRCRSLGLKSRRVRRSRWGSIIDARWAACSARRRRSTVLLQTAVQTMIKKKK